MGDLPGQLRAKAACAPKLAYHELRLQRGRLFFPFAIAYLMGMCKGGEQVSKIEASCNSFIDGFYPTET